MSKMAFPIKLIRKSLSKVGDIIYVWYQIYHGVIYKTSLLDAQQKNAISAFLQPRNSSNTSLGVKML